MKIKKILVIIMVVILSVVVMIGCSEVIINYVKEFVNIFSWEVIIFEVIGIVSVDVKGEKNDVIFIVIGYCLGENGYLEVKFNNI